MGVEIFYYGELMVVEIREVLVKVIGGDKYISPYHFCLDNAGSMGASLLPTTSTNSDQVAEEI
jgi:hypothetical protein